jgi:hypothetical protein
MPARSTSLGALHREHRISSQRAIDGLINGRGRVARLAVGPHSLVPAFAQEAIGHAEAWSRPWPEVGYPDRLRYWRIP